MPASRQSTELRICFFFIQTLKELNIVLSLERSRNNELSEQWQLLC